MTKSVEQMNKAALQLIIDHENKKIRLFSGEYESAEGRRYYLFTDNLVMYMIPADDCLVHTGISYTESLARVIPKIPEKPRKIDTNITFIKESGRGKNLMVYQTYDDHIGINVKLLKGFGSDYEILETAQRGMFAIFTDEKLRGFVCGVRLA